MFQRILIINILFFTSFFCNSQGKSPCAKLEKHFSFNSIYSGKINYFSNCDIHISTIFWGPEKLEPHPASLKYIDSLSLVLHKFPKLKLYITTSYNSNIDVKRAEFLVEKLRTQYLVSNKLIVRPKGKNQELSGLIIRFEE